MLKNVPRRALCNIASNSIRQKALIDLQHSSVTKLSFQTRNTYILKRRHPPPTANFNEDITEKPLEEPTHFIYDYIVRTDFEKQKKLKLLLIKPVEDLGLPGDVVEVGPNIGRESLLLPKLAVYASPENLEKYKDIATHDPHEVPSSRFAYKTVKILESSVYSVHMNVETPWQIEPWHVRVALRPLLVLPESSIILPSQPIIGPDVSLHGKEFLVRIKINNKEEARTRVRIFLDSSNPLKRLPRPENFREIRAQPVFPDSEDAVVLAELNDNDPLIVTGLEEDENLL